jgi:phosphate:Na+ symporter
METKGGSEMKEPRVFVNPLRILSLRLDREAVRLDDRRTAPQEVSFEESLITTAGKIMDIIRLISKCIVTGDTSEMDRGAALAEDVHQQEKMLTKNLLSSGVRGELFKGLVRFPSRLERIGDSLETILRCCRIKAREGISFSDKAEEELGQLFAMLLEMMNNVRDAFRTPNKLFLESIISQGRQLTGMLGDSRLAHWERMEAGFCSPRASSVFLEVLDSMKLMNEYIQKMCNTLIELGKDLK